ncbi:MAG: nucleotidyltransferase domain-containing protein [Anaerolineales bacterium]|nr:nucleotidyltransferase domain-containing protein [Anaerolineales bacterium]MDW8445893.1 nucleotidyltransferase domain-containing protein [Anaerolineales bacterium]
MIAISLKRDEVYERLCQVAQEAIEQFPEVCEIRLFGSLARVEETGLSDIDLFLVTERKEENPIERVRPYFMFFSERVPLAVDLIAVQPQEVEEFAELLSESRLLARREAEIG